MKDEKYMRLALDEAEKARRINEVPVGCIIVDSNGSILSRSHNLRESNQDPTAHAELIAIRKASQKLNSWRLIDTTLYVTLEPCAMCMGAIINSRVKRVVFGALDEKAGALVSNYNIGISKNYNHLVEYSEGILRNECALILKNFFKQIRN